MPITKVYETTFSGSGSTITLSYPFVLQPGDLAFVALTVGYGPAFATNPPGWNGTNAVRHYVSTAGGESGQFTFTLTNGASNCGGYFVIFRSVRRFFGSASHDYGNNYSITTFNFDINGTLAFDPTKDYLQIYVPELCPPPGGPYPYGSTITSWGNNPTVVNPSSGIARTHTNNNNEWMTGLAYRILPPGSSQQTASCTVSKPMGGRTWTLYFEGTVRHQAGATLPAVGDLTASGNVMPYSARVTIDARGDLTARGRVSPFGIPVAYQATTDGTDAGSTADCRPDGARRAILRFPIRGEIPPLAAIRKVELRASVTVPGAADGVWAIRAYPDRADPEQDDFATQYMRAGQGPLYATTTAFRSAGVAAIDLGADAVAGVSTACDPRWGYLALAILQTAGQTGSSIRLDNANLTVWYDVPPPVRRPLAELVTTTLFAPGVPVRPARIDIADYAIRVRMRWQGPGDFTLTVPAGSTDAAALADMGLVLVRVAGQPVFCGVQETWRVRRTLETGLHGPLIEVSGQSIHRFLANRITGPFPTAMNHAQQPWQTPIGTDVEVFATGDPSPRGAAFGAASSSAESVLRKLLMTHTVAADPARRTAWTNNLRFAPDNRRGVDTGTTVSTRLQPLLAEAEKLCHRADCGYEVVLADDGTFRWHFLPGANRTGERGRWMLSADLTPGVQEVEVTRDVTQLVTHVYLAGAGTGAQRTLGVYRQQGSMETMETRYDRREAAVDGANATSDAAAELYATAYLSQHLPRRTVTLSLPNLLDAGWLTAWYLGDQLTVVDPETGISEVQRVYEIELVIGTESQVQAVLGDVVDPAIVAILEPVEGGPTVAAGTVVTAPSPLPSPGTWKETGQATLR